MFYAIMCLSTGSIAPVNIEQSKVLNYYYNQICTWILDSNIERELFVEVASSQDSEWMIKE